MKLAQSAQPPARTEARKDAGFSFVEVLLGATVFVVAAVVLGNHVAVNFRSANSQRDQVFAYTKAQAILSEIHALVDRGDVEAAVDLDILDDGITPKPQLTISTDDNGNLLSPDHVLSNNVWRRGNWVWGRQISVRPFAGLNNRNVRYVTVRISKRDQQGELHELASLSSVVNSISSAFPATQVFDVYLLAVENIPGWWVFMESIVPFVESSVTDLENRNPGLSVRTHWITKAGFGRNRVYRPVINETIDSYSDYDGAYVYPGLMPAGNASTNYYVADLMQARIQVDGLQRNGYDANTNPYPYALADFYNHCMRWPQAVELNDQRVKLAEQRQREIELANLTGATVPPELDDMSTEPTLRVLIERMSSDPDAYRHALVVNLHGELLPTPPLRNYSDPAKAPEIAPGVRVVVHPEEIRTQSPPDVAGLTTDVRLRVYAWLTEPDSAVLPEVMPDHMPIVMEVMDMDLTDGSGYGRLHPMVRLENVVGGVPLGATADPSYFPPQEAKHFGDSRSWQEMFYGAWFVDRGPGERKATIIALYSTPLRCRQVGTQGLYPNRRSRLYNLEYQPSPDTFDDGLWEAGDGPKNTARWILTIPGDTWNARLFRDRAYPPNAIDPRTTTEPDVLLTVRTRIWDAYNPLPWDTGAWPEGTSALINQPDNLSETYTWWAASREAVPFTERAQFHGDPRHNPYVDLMAGDPDFGDGYNWFFESLSNGSGENAIGDYPGIRRRWDRWNGGPRFDVPRLMELYRSALVKAGAIYTTLSGYSYYYVGCGNEIGYDSSNGYPNSIPVNLRPWGGAPGSTGYVNNITGARCYVRSQGAGYWWGMPWLGELYPDWAYYSDWAATDADGRLRGNLGTESFFRITEQSAHNGSGYRGFGSDSFSQFHRTNTRGCVSFFNNGTSSSHFNHVSTNGDGRLVGPGIELRDNYGFPIPDTAYINRPFNINTGGNVPPEFSLNPYNVERSRATLLRTFFDHPTGNIGSGLVQVEDAAGENAAWIVVNGLGQTTATGSSFLAKYCLLSMYQSFFELGDASLQHRIKQPPRVEISSPTDITELRDPGVIPIRIETEWIRWDRLPYTASTPASFAEDESEILYAITYSRDNGITWQHVDDNSVATIQRRPEDPSHLIRDLGTGADEIDWVVPRVEFPEGSYLLRVEAYREDMALHYSVHQVKIYIQR